MGSIFSRKAGKKIFRVFSIALVLAYLLALAGWYFPVDIFFILGFASIGFIWLWLLLPVWILLFLFKKKTIPAAIFFVLWLAGWFPATASFSIGMSKNFEVSKPAGTIRIMQWNCMSLPGNVINWYPYTTERKQAAEFIAAYQPDIICLEDFSEISSNIIRSNIALLRDSLGYRYFIFAKYSQEIKKYGKVANGTAIFSKIPFMQSGMIPYQNRDFPESIIYADVMFQGKPLRLVATHFRSMNLFGKYGPESEGMVPLPYYLMEDSLILANGSIPEKISFYQQEHLSQARELRMFLDSCNMPVVLCTDLNTVPANYIYRYIKKDLQDGFLGSAFGMGETYNSLAPNIRIDYVFHDKKLRANQWKHFPDGFFDHDQIMADFVWKQPLEEKE